MLTILQGMQQKHNSLKRNPSTLPSFSCGSSKTVSGPAALRRGGAQPQPPCGASRFFDWYNASLHLVPHYNHRFIIQQAAACRHNRADPYHMQAPTINETAIKVDGRPQVFTSDGSLRRFLHTLRDGTALVGVQNANLIL